MEKEILYIRGYWKIPDIVNIEADYIQAQEEFEDKYRFDGAVVLEKDGFFKGTVVDILNGTPPQAVIGKMSSEREDDTPVLIVNKVGGPSPILFSVDLGGADTFVGTYGHFEDGELYESNEIAIITIITPPENRMETVESIENKFQEVIRLARPEAVSLINDLLKDPYILWDAPRYEDEYTKEI